MSDKLAREIMLKALQSGEVSDADHNAFDEWKFDHSSDDILNTLIDIGHEIECCYDLHNPSKKCPIWTIK